MKVRPIETTDIEALRYIHEQYYQKDFDFPNFFSHFLAPLAITDDSNRIITAGGILPIAEIIILTDKNIDLMDRVKALQLILEKSKYMARLYHFPRIHGFVHEQTWKKYMLVAGFKQCKGDILSIEVS
jgi:hypothetical protein